MVLIKLKTFTVCLKRILRNLRITLTQYNYVFTNSEVPGNWSSKFSQSAVEFNDLNKCLFSQGFDAGILRN